MNLGAVARSAAFFGLQALLVTSAHSAAPSPVASKASSGALETLDMYRADNMNAAMLSASQAGWTIVGTHVAAQSQADDGPVDRRGAGRGPGDGTRVGASAANGHEKVPHFSGKLVSSMALRCHGPTVVVFGNEGSGLADSTLSICHQVCSIARPQASEIAHPTLDSLNISTAAAVLFHQLTQSRPQP